jgi:carbon storage regulator CsrA
VIGDNIVVTVLKIEGGRVRLGFKAPQNVRIQRTELLDRASIIPAIEQKCEAGACDLQWQLEL